MTSNVIERIWIYSCGIDVLTTIHLYWELFVDTTLVIGCYLLCNKTFVQTSDTASPVEALVELSLLYFSIINGWFLYAHQYTSRFYEISRIHSILIWIFISSLGYAVMNASFETYREFSKAMILMRIAIFGMLFRVACYVDRAQPLSALLAVFIGDAILCYALSAASDVESAAILWGFVAITELHVDLFLAVGLRGPTLQIPFQLQTTINRFYVIIFAPIGSMIISCIIGNNKNTTIKDHGPEKYFENLWYNISSIILLVLLALLYYTYKEPLVENMRRQSHFEKACLLILMKMFGYTLWSINACLVVTIQSQHTETNNKKKKDGTSEQQSSSYDIILGWMIGAALLCLFNIRSLSGQRHDWIELIWIIFAVVTFLLPHFFSDQSDTKQSLILLSINVVMVLILYLFEFSHTFCDMWNTSGQRPRQDNNARNNTNATTRSRGRPSTLIVRNEHDTEMEEEQQPLISSTTRNSSATNLYATTV